MQHNDSSIFSASNLPEALYKNERNLSTYPNRLMKDRYAGSKTSATASLRDSRSSVSGTVH